MNDAIEGIIVRRIPSRVIKFHIKDKTWFNEDCKRANLAKQEAYQLWRRNCSDITWNNYVILRNDAQETYAAAERVFFFSFSYGWEYRTGTMFPFSSLHPSRKGKEM